MKFGNQFNVTGLGGGKVGKTLQQSMSMPGGPEAPPTSGTITTAMRDFADAWQALDEPTHAGMASDPDHQREMVLMTSGLAARADCTHVAVQDGNWTGSTTWMSVSTRDFATPGAGAKLGVPAGITVTMNNNTTTAYDTLRVDGSVVYPIDQDTKLYIDTIVVNHGGVWQQGTALNPIPAAYTSEVVFPDNGNIDTTLVTGDYLLLGRGFLGMGATLMAPSSGSITICGADKTKWALTSQARSVGNTTIIVDTLPSDWAVGDEIYIAGTTPRLSSSVDHQYDVVEITALNAGTREITFTPALQYARGVPTLTGFPSGVDKYHVCNLTRNVRYYSPAGTAVEHRGHVMVMGENIYIRAAEYRNLGRTRKAHSAVTGVSPDPSFDATNDAARITINGGDTAWAADANVRGRYNLHVHRSGVATGQDYAQLINCVSHIAPGWGVAHHQSNCDITDCISVVFSGVGFMAEIGSEDGSWSGNFGGGATQRSTGDEQQQKQQNGNDFGLFGDAFWFKGRAVELDGNIGANCNAAYGWMSRYATSMSEPNAATSPEPRVFYGGEAVVGAVDLDRPSIHNFKNNGMYATVYSLFVIKAGVNQGHSYRSNFFNTWAWNIFNGLEFEYTGAYTITNTYIHRLSSLSRADRALYIKNTAGDMIVDGDVVVRGPWSIGLSLLAGGLQWDTADNRNRAITDGFAMDAGITQTEGAAERFIAESSLTSVTDQEFTPAAEPVFPVSTYDGDGQTTFLHGTQTTEFGLENRHHEAIPPDNLRQGLNAHFSTAGLRQLLIRDGYWTYTHPTHGASKYLLVPDLITKKRLDVNGDVQRRYLTVVMRLLTTITGIDYADYANNGALGAAYVSAITAETYVVYEDILA